MSKHSAAEPGDDERQEPRVIFRDKRRLDPETGEVRTPAASSTNDAAGAAPAAGADKVTELQGDLQRLGAEYANYRKRTERDRVVIGQQATGKVLTSLLPVLDDIERAREHGDLTGAFASVADKLQQSLSASGLVAFGEVGEQFDPNRHEAVMHQTSADVTGPTCVLVMRRGYSLGDVLLRPAMVGVAEPEPAPADSAGHEEQPAGDAPATEDVHED